VDLTAEIKISENVLSLLGALYYIIHGQSKAEVCDLIGSDPRLQ